jgi:hypothetical protein
MRRARPWSHRTGQRGASLVIVLVLTTVMFILVPVLLRMVTTGTLFTPKVVDDRVELYAVTSAIDAAIQRGVEDLEIGDLIDRQCPSSQVEVNGFVVDVACQMHAADQVPEGCFYRDRMIVLYADVQGSNATARADVIYRFGSGRVEVHRWTNDAVVTPTTTMPSLPDCNAPPPPPPPPPAPGVQAIAAWGPLEPDPRPGTVFPPGWRAEETLIVTDENDVPIEGAKVTVAIRHRDAASGVWAPAANVVGDTTDGGSITVYSDTYKRNGAGSVDLIELTVVDVTDELDGRTWANAGDTNLLITVARP